MPANDTNERRLARTLSQRTGLSYQAALQRVRRAARSGQLPAIHNAPGRTQALHALLQGLHREEEATASDRNAQQPDQPEQGQGERMTYPDDPHAPQGAAAAGPGLDENGLLPDDPRFPDRPRTRDLAMMSRAAFAADDRGVRLGVDGYLRELGQDPQTLLPRLRQEAQHVLDTVTAEATPGSLRTQQHAAHAFAAAWVTGFSTGVGRADTDSAIRQEALNFTAMLKRMTGEEITAEDLTRAVGADHQSVQYMARQRTRHLLEYLQLNEGPAGALTSLMLELVDSTAVVLRQATESAMIDGLCVGMTYVRLRATA